MITWLSSCSQYDLAALDSSTAATLCYNGKKCLIAALGMKACSTYAMTGIAFALDSAVAALYTIQAVLGLSLATGRKVSLGGPHVHVNWVISTMHAG